MDPINPWLDREEVRRLAERLMISVAQPRMTKPDAGFDLAFVGYEAEQPAPSPLPPQSPPEAPNPAPNPAPPTSPAVSAEPAAPSPQATPEQLPPAPEPPRTAFQNVPAAAAPTIDVSSQFTDSDLEPGAPQSNARGPFLERIIQFRFWLSERFSATGIFILDREGSVIFDESGHGKLHFLARSLALASRRPGTPAGNVHVKVGSSATLEVIPVETPYGCLVLGAVVQESLDPSSVQEIMHALLEVASPPA
ncbi:hypothetical protein JIN85_04850 [Luteolibacter pohnpeiensis]|uniref:Uncharacterized protein n=1 Tax=Luteolibacter pohnpeiensis TaxID=454153 RepID=A0A934S5P1_9BACT|nr:hypothetical protein [Luteolibacter pohnpeiensis]MBK1881730.1 hypothetical protein [Luteolibacter pohnpeiensis]